METKDHKQVFKEENSSFYDLEYFISMEYRYFSHAHQSKVDNAFKIVGDVKGLKSLDIGCGGGFFVHELSNRGSVSIGVDYSPYAIQFAKERFKGLDFRVLSGYDLSIFEDSTFDIVFLLDVIEHISNQDKVLSELYRVLKPGGSLLLSTDLDDSAWNKNFMKRIIWATQRLSSDGRAYRMIKKVESYRKQFKNYHDSHIALLSDEELKKKIIKAGFSLKKHIVYPLVAVPLRDFFFQFLPRRWRGEHQMMLAKKLKN